MVETISDLRIDLEEKVNKKQFLEGTRGIPDT